VSEDAKKKKARHHWQGTERSVAAGNSDPETARRRSRNQMVLPRIARITRMAALRSSLMRQTKGNVFIAHLP